MKILYIAEIVGKAGIYAVKKLLPALKVETGCDFTIACADGATGGNGLGRNHAGYLRKLGVDVLTLGECCFFKKDLTENIVKIPYVLRPYNLNDEAPGNGFRVYKTAKGEKIAVVVLLGQNGFTRMHAGNIYSGIEGELERFARETPFCFIDMHALAGAEKIAYCALAKGKVTAVIGSHTRVQSADERIEDGTAMITDAGRTGSSLSVGGCEPQGRVREFLTGIPDWTREALEKPELQGVLIEADRHGQAVSITRIKRAAPEMPKNEKTDKDELNE